MKTLVFGGFSSLILAVILGFLSRNSFLIILFRSIITSTVVVAGIVIGSLLIKKFIPELVSMKTDDSDMDNLVVKDDGGKDQSMGRVVNMVVSDEDEEGGDSYLPEYGAKMNRTSRYDDDGDQESQNFFAGPGSLSEVVEEVAGNSFSSPLGASNDLSSKEEDEEFKDNSFYAGVENLPDIAGFETSFHENVGNKEGSYYSDDDEDDFKSPSAPSERVITGPGGVDSQLMARAISTALKKGQ